MRKSFRGQRRNKIWKMKDQNMVLKMESKNVHTSHSGLERLFGASQRVLFFDPGFASAITIYVLPKITMLLHILVPF